MGVLSRTFTLEAKEPPWPPQVLAAGDVTSTSACLWWTVGFDGGAPQTFLLRRKVDINDVDDEKCEMAVVPDKEEQRVERCVQGLTPGTNYTFLLIATNRYGVCSSTVILNISTPSQSLYTTAWRLSQLLDSDVKEPENNNSLVDSITPWVVKVVPVGVCLILLVAGGVVIAKRLRRGEKDSPDENMYLTIQETQSVYENEDDEGEITVTAHAPPSGTELRHYGSDGPIRAYETLLPRGENGDGPIRAYDALLPFVTISGRRQPVHRHDSAHRHRDTTTGKRQRQCLPSRHASKHDGQPGAEQQTTDKYPDLRTPAMRQERSPEFTHGRSRTQASLTSLRTPGNTDEE
ncbi:hypothetical protein C0Q70_12602 [Pomacea canaliculata]|uniref:Fibronectin type-III domain-containing protein n=1 Tax=Pomacea canaliculata TaxID=400727 RepID=A0A2T7P227_POMCA|nr:hypothetical protein C0Q70_12602 [Pomacea canaliculata]